MNEDKNSADAYDVQQECASSQSAEFFNVEEVEDFLSINLRSEEPSHRFFIL
jgi:hypothetical protein